MAEISFANTTVKSRNRSMDVLKLIASYMVVFIHFSFSGESGYIVDALARFAVPVFFMVSGYFSYLNTAYKLKSKIINVVKIYISGFILYFCFNCAAAFFDMGIKGVMWYCYSYVNITKIIRFVVFNVPISSDHLWFLWALIYVYIIQYFVTRHKIKERVYWPISLYLLVTHLFLGVGLSSFGVVVPIYIVRNFLFMGYPFFCMGILLRKKEDVILKKVTYKVLLAVILIGISETLISYFISGKNELYIGSVLIAGALFVMALKSKDIRLDTVLVKLSKTSLIIYLIHIAIGRMFLRLLPANKVWLEIISPFFICLASTLVSLVLEKIRYKYTKY